MLVRCRVPPAVCRRYQFFTPGWREIMWGKVSCLRKQHDGRDWVSNHRPSDLKPNALNTTPLCPTLEKDDWLFTSFAIHFLICVIFSFIKWLAIAVPFHPLKWNCRVILLPLPVRFTGATFAITIIIRFAI